MGMKQIIWICGLLCVALSLPASSPIVHTTLPDDSTTGGKTGTVKANTNISDSSADSSLVTTKVFTQFSVSHTASSSDSLITQINDLSSTVPVQSSPYTSLTTLSSSSPTGGQSSVKKEKKGLSIWQGISIGLGSLCFILMLAFIMTVVIICRLRGQLKRVRNTLYPTSAETDHVYSELSHAANGSGKPKPSVKVELRPLKITEQHEELNVEEIHSPMSPDLQPVSSPFLPETTQNDSSAPPPVKSRPPKRPATVPELSTAKPALIQHSYTNVGFDNTDNQELKHIGNMESQTNDNDEDDIYEEYLNPSLQKIGQASPNIASTMDTVVKTQKIAKNADEPSLLEVERQNSLSGLPEAVIQRVNSQLGADGMPLQDFEEGSVQDIDSGIPMCDFTSGLPSQTSLTLDDLDPYENIDTYKSNETVVTSNVTQQIPDSSTSVDDGELYENTDKIDGVQSHNRITLSSYTTGLPTRTNSTEFDPFPLYDDGDVKMSTDNFDMDVELYDNHNTMLGSVTDSMPPCNTGGKDKRNGTEYSSDNNVHFSNFDNMPFEIKQPGVQVKPNTLHIPLASNENGPLPFSSAESAPGNQNGRFVDLDSLAVFKNDPLRLRSDSASTPENYYLDLEDPNPVLHVEESKRISTQFPSDFYTRENSDLHAPEKNINSMPGDPFYWDYQPTQNDRQSGDQKISLEFENSVHSNVNFTDPPDFFGTDSTT